MLLHVLGPRVNKIYYYYADAVTAEMHFSNKTYPHCPTK